MNTHVSLLEANGNKARILYTIIIDGTIIFQKEIEFNVGETFSNGFKIAMGNLGEMENIEQNRYDVEFSIN